MSAPAPARITRQDIEAKLRQVRGEVDTAGEAATKAGTMGAAVAGVVLIVAVYLIGKRRGRRSSTVVEIKRF
ncbi:MAG: hypothetical protein AB1673_11735 [Actinomycetota bacterium]|jgi:hypothetical protein